MTRPTCLALALAIGALLNGTSLRAEWYRGRYEIESEIAPIDHMNYLFFLPQKSSNSHAPRGDWPLIVSLHDKGQEGEADSLLLLHGLPRLADANRDFLFAVLAPHLPTSMPWDVSQFVPVFELEPELWVIRKARHFLMIFGKHSASTTSFRGRIATSWYAIVSRSFTPPRQRGCRSPPCSGVRAG